MDLCYLVLCYFQNEISSNEFLEFFFWEIAPKFHLVNGSNEGSGNALEVLKLLAEIACHVKDLENTKGQIDAVFSLLLVSVYTDKKFIGL